uniref:GST N-terminal domain-containing protein n=1 Tax=Panagrolaimus sp. JU765 TaxID=591449 RepID=A0AC34R6G6_9BILA
MSTFKLEYLPGRYYGETARLIFHFSGQKFDDVKVDNDSWPKRKPTTPFGTVPVLTVDENIEIGQSMAIYHYLGRKFNLTGKDELEIAQVNALGDYQKELMVSTLDFVHALYGNNSDLEKIKQENFIPNLNKFWPILVDHLKKSKSGFFVNSGTNGGGGGGQDELLVTFGSELTSDFSKIFEGNDVVSFMSKPDFFNKFVADPTLKTGGHSR